MESKATAAPPRCDLAMSVTHSSLGWCQQADLCWCCWGCCHLVFLKEICRSIYNNSNIFVLLSVHPGPRRFPLLEIQLTHSPLQQSSSGHRRAGRGMLLAKNKHRKAGYQDLLLPFIASLERLQLAWSFPPGAGSWGMLSPCSSGRCCSAIPAIPLSFGGPWQWGWI